MADSKKDQEKKRQSFLSNLLKKFRIAPGSLESATLGAVNKKLDEATQKMKK